MVRNQTVDRKRGTHPMHPTGDTTMRKLLIGLVFLVACGGDSSTNPNSADISGSYSLKTVNGSPLPFTIQSGANSVVILSDALILASNGSWSETTSYRQTINGQTTTGTATDAGTWVRAGAGVSMKANSGCDYNGTYGSNSLTLTDCNSLVSGFTR